MSKASIFGLCRSCLVASLSLHSCYGALSQPNAQIYITAIFDRGLPESISFIVSQGPEENNACVSPFVPFSSTKPSTANSKKVSELGAEVEAECISPNLR